ncbi:MAG: VOC family protein [Calditrichaeota bacterium]|nr:VOC family protein [Calditrichota bacterium]MCB9391763.1 VOC family protein [Calditrichota bacterium]
MHSFCHIELVTTNLAQAAEFYTKLFGWTCAPMMEGYWMIDLGDPDGVSGGLVLADTIVDNGGQNYVEVGDIDATLSKANSLGAKTVQEKRPLPENMGFIAMIELQDGYKLGLFSRS